MFNHRSLVRPISSGLGQALAILLAVMPAAAAGIYQWTDAEGAVHFTDDPGTIPRQFRDTARENVPPEPADESSGSPSPESTAVEREPPPEQRAVTPAEPAPPSKPQPEVEPEPDAAVSSEPVDAQGNSEDWWRARAKEWRDKKADAEANLAEAQERLGHERFLNDRSGQMKRIQDLSAEVEKYQKQVRDADHMLTDVLPDEARRAQAPPGWLRE